MNRWRVVSTVPKSELASLAGLGDDFVFEHLQGRMFNKRSELYHLPHNVAEHQRLDIQHAVWKLTLDGLYQPKDLVQYALRQDQLGVPSILDLGTGSGRWALEMAQEFPHCEVLGLDLTPPTLLRTERVPENCRFDVANANDPMEYYAQAFNVVHLRSVETGILDFQPWLYQIAKVLKPNGVLLLGAGVGVVGEDGKRLPRRAFGDPNFSWVEYIFATIESVMHSEKNFSLETGIQWTGWLQKNPNYKDITTQSFLVPIGPWKPNMTEKEVEAANLLKDDIIRVLDSFRGLLTKAGFDGAAIEQAVNNATKELEDQRTHIYFHWLHTSAVRTPLLWQDAPK